MLRCIKIHSYPALQFNEILHLQACLACKGSIVFTGVGKSGFIAQKISQTLISTGTRAMYLNPTDALHGDLVRLCWSATCKGRSCGEWGVG